MTFGIEVADRDLPEKPAVDELDASSNVGIDLGIRNYIHTSDGLTVDMLNLASTNACGRSNESNLDAPREVIMPVVTVYRCDRTPSCGKSGNDLRPAL